MTRFFGIAAVVALLVHATVSPASAAHHRSADGVPIKGTVTGEHWVDRPPGPDGWQFFSSGTGQMSHLGRVDYFLTQSSSFGPGGVVVSTGTITFTAPNGDTLVIAQAVTSEIVGDLAGFTLSGTWHVDGGTGRFASATGSGSMDGVGDIPGGDALFGLPDGAAQFDFMGGIAYNASDRAK